MNEPYIYHDGTMYCTSRMVIIATVKQDNCLLDRL